MLKVSETIKKLFTILALSATLAFAGCSTTDQNNALLGGATGAVIGGVATGSLEGAAVGGAIGAGAGVLLGRVANTQNQCYYRNRYGVRYVAPCR